MSFKLPADAPAQVRSWLMDYNRFKARGHKGKEKADELAAKIEKYLKAVDKAGGVTLKPPVTKAERDIAQAKSSPHFTKLTFGRMY